MTLEDDHVDSLVAILATFSSLFVLFFSLIHPELQVTLLLALTLWLPLIYYLGHILSRRIWRRDQEEGEKYLYKYIDDLETQLEELEDENSNLVDIIDKI
jgi:hypothetical protein